MSVAIHDLVMYHPPMERFIIGSCRSGKFSTSYPSLDGLDTPNDVFDSMAMLFLMATREYRRNKDSELANHLLTEAEDSNRY